MWRTWNEQHDPESDAGGNERVVTTLAGLAGSYWQPDGTGSAARFNHPVGMAVDSAGNIYVADSGNETIREGYLASLSAGTTITFDDLGNEEGPITNGYHGLDWNNFDFLDGPPFKTATSLELCRARMSPSTAAGLQPNFSRHTLTLTSGYFTAAWNNGLSLEVIGLNGSTNEYDNTYTLNESGPLLIGFPDVPVTEVEVVVRAASPPALGMVLGRKLPWIIFK